MNTPNPKPHLRIAVDIGGTFTDMAAFDEATGKLLFGKALSTHGQLVNGIQATLDSASIDLKDGNLFLHGSTIAINTLLERNGANTALLITEGFRDIYEIGRVNRPDAYNLFFNKHQPLVKRSLRFEVAERLRADGSTHKPLDEAAVREAGLAGLLHDIGKPKTRRFESGGGVSFHHHEVVGAKIARKRLTAMRYPGDVIDSVCKLTELHLRFHGYGQGQWTDSAVRRYVRDAGDELSRLHKLTRADCTTRNPRRAAILSATYDDLEERIATLAQQEELNSIRPDLDGNDIMEILNVPSGPMIGKAYNHLLNVRLDEGPLTREQAIERLTTWWNAQSKND